MNMTEKYTDFGFERVALGEKAKRVRGVFDSVASQYDFMNDVMSAGMHRLWKRFAISQCALRRGQVVLDVAGGTGDMTLRIRKEVGDTGYVVLSDINSRMLVNGRDRVIDSGYVEGIAFAQADAEQLPFARATFDCICISFGLRNVTNKERALRSMYELLKPGGRVVILEFSEIANKKLSALYDLYSFKVLPRLGEVFANDAPSYRYLAESIRKHPNQLALMTLLRSAGFEQCSYQNLSAGIVAIHLGFKF